MINRVLADLVVLAHFVFIVCALREASGHAGEPGGFIEHHLLPMIYPGELSREIRLILGGVLVGVNSIAY